LEAAHLGTLTELLVDVPLEPDMCQTLPPMNATTCLLNTFDLKFNDQHLESECVSENIIVIVWLFCDELKANLPYQVHESLPITIRRRTNKDRRRIVS
jgi:hypothetical protein